MATNLIASMLAKQLFGDTLKNIGKDRIVEYVRKKMEDSIPKMETALTGISFSGADKEKKLHNLVRDILFRLWRAVVKRSIAADFIRDSHDDGVLEKLMPELLAKEHNLDEIIKMVLEATLEKAF